MRACVGREACSSHKTKGLFCLRSPTGQLVTGAAGELRAREGGRESQCVTVKKKEREGKEREGQSTQEER